MQKELHFMSLSNRVLRGDKNKRAEARGCRICRSRASIKSRRRPQRIRQRFLFLPHASRDTYTPFPKVPGTMPGKIISNKGNLIFETKIFFNVILRYSVGGDFGPDYSRPRGRSEWSAFAGCKGPLLARRTFHRIPRQETAAVNQPEEESSSPPPPLHFSNKTARKRF